MTISSALLAVAPKCPICFFAYFGIFGVATTTASAYRVWLPPLTALWLMVTVGLLITAAGGRRHWGPVALGVLGAASVFAGRFPLEDQRLVYAGLAALAGAVVWRSFRGVAAGRENCAACDEVPARTEPGAG